MLGVVRPHFTDVDPEPCLTMLRISPQGDVKDLDSDLDSPRSWTANSRSNSSKSGNSHWYALMSFNYHKEKLQGKKMICQKGGVSQPRIIGLSHAKVQALNQATLWPPFCTYPLPTQRRVWPFLQRDAIKVSKKWKGRGQPHTHSAGNHHSRLG